LVYLDSSQHLSCSMEKLGFTAPTALLRLMKEGGKVNFDQSILNAVAKPQHAVELYTKQGDTILMHARWYKDKIDVASLSKGDSLLCPR